MYLKIFFLTAAILGISQGGVTKGRYEASKGRGIEAKDPYLMGGYVIESRIYQSMVSIWYKGQHVCGGVIVTEMWILTAAQCLKNRLLGYITVVVGSNNLFDGVNHTVKSAMESYDYNPADSWRNDIGLLMVEEPIKFTSEVQPAKLPIQGETVDFGTQGVVIGWGSQEAGGKPSRDLRGLNVTVADSSDCNKAYNPFNLHVYNEQFCAGGYGGKGTCDGDLGGPLIIDNKVMGIVSWGRPCGYYGYPTVYTRVSEYIHWINFET